MQEGSTVRWQAGLQKLDTWQAELQKFSDRYRKYIIMAGKATRVQIHRRQGCTSFEMSVTV
jgi:hypothetical protein